VLSRQYCTQQNRISKEKESSEHYQEEHFPQSVSSQSSNLSNRRETLQKIFATAALSTTTTTSILASNVKPAQAGIPEIDKTGELYSPKNEMLGGGGSAAARGIKLEQRVMTSNNERKQLLGGLSPIQTIYDTRFIAYLSRFLLNFDPATRSWWLKQELGDGDGSKTSNKRQLRFAEFAASVEIGLADYFVGPYGSYASVQAAKAGLNAAMPATSSSNLVNDSGFQVSNFFKKLIDSNKGTSQTLSYNSQKAKYARQGILNLFALLKARYTSYEEKNQLAILFTLISDPNLQPTAVIKGLLGEADDASIQKIKLVYPTPSSSSSSISSTTQSNTPSIYDNFRESSRRGGGYAFGEKPRIYIDAPPSLGDDYQPADAYAVMKPTTRLLRIKVTDGGSGYTSIPTVKVISSHGVKIPCDVCAILDRYGSVESILVLNPGLGYGEGGSDTEENAPNVVISPPIQKRNGSKKGADDKSLDLTRPAKAVAELEYAIDSIEVRNTGNGYTTIQPPQVKVYSPEEDPDWYVYPIDKNEWREKEMGYLSAEVSSMTYRRSEVWDVQEISMMSDETVKMQNMLETFPTIVKRLENDPLALLPSTLRPTIIDNGTESGFYNIASLPTPSTIITLSSKYRSFDPIFGGVGAKPVMKGAQSLTSSEYSRLALSGAVCTVIVRTALNPLELVKTKIQLENDPDLLEYAKNSSKGPDINGDDNLSTENKPENPIKQKVEPMPVSVISSEENDTDRQILQKKSRRSISSKDIDKEWSTFKAKRSEADTEDESKEAAGTVDIIKALIEIRGPSSLFQSADITFLASLVFGSIGFGSTELFRRSFTLIFFDDGGGSQAGQELTLLAAAGLGCILTSAIAAPFELLRVRSMGYVDSNVSLVTVLSDFLIEKRNAADVEISRSTKESQLIGIKDISKDDLMPLFSGFYPILSRELPFAVTKFLAFDLIATSFISFINAQPQVVDTVEVGVGAVGLTVSACSGAIAGLAGAFVSHPADLILTLTSGSSKEKEGDSNTSDWKPIVKDLLNKPGGIANLFAGLPARAAFFFLVIGFQFFLYDYAKTVFQVGSDDLTLVLDVFYAIRQGLVNMEN